MKIKILIIILLFTQSVSAKLIINEVLSNEPGGSTSLEWIELYNDSTHAVQLSDYTIVVNDVLIILPSQIIAPDAYIVLSRKLFSSADESSFESYWGNGSKVWGDSEFEMSITEPIELSFSLPNPAGTILLLDGNIEISSFSWDESGKDSVSWERKFSDSTSILPSVSKNNSTPGITNSITLLQHDLSIESVTVIVENLIPTYSFQISNRGLTDINDGMLYINQYQFELPHLTSDSSLIIDVNLNSSQSSLYQQRTAFVYTMNDNRASNDSLVFTMVSEQYPPLLISEFLANPQDDKSTEWLEIYNRSNVPVDLINWSVGDEFKVSPITIESYILSPNQYVLLTKSRNDFFDEHQSFIGNIIEVASWAILNNENDAVRLVDSFDITADIYTYTKLYEENYTVARELFDGTFSWGRSSEPNGTPGFENSVFKTDTNSQPNLILNSKYISPDGDGYEDNVIIEIDVPDSKYYSLKLYDVNGVLVRTFFNEASYISNRIVWDGLSDNNSKLPIGIYILYLLTDDGLSTKETIVIAR